MAAPAVQRQPGAIARQRKFSYIWLAEAILAIFLLWILYNWNYRLLWGWYFYYREYTLSFSNASTTTAKECRLIMQEPDLWRRVSWDPYWWLRKRCEGALHGQLGNGDVLAQALGFIAWLVITYLTKMVGVAWLEAPQRVILLSLALVSSSWSCTKTVIKSTVGFFYGLGQGIRSFEFPISKVSLCINDKRQCGPFIAWLASLQVLVPTFMLLLPYLIYRQFGQDRIVKGLKKSINASNEVFDHSWAIFCEVCAPVINMAIGAYHLWDHVWQSLPFKFYDASMPFWKHPLLIVLVMAEIVFLALLKDFIETIFKIVAFSVSAWVFIFPQHLRGVFGYPHELISSLLAKGDKENITDEGGQEGQKPDEEEDPLSRLLANLQFAIYLAVFVYLSHQSLGAIAVTIPETSSLDITVWTSLLHIGFGWVFFATFDDNFLNRVLTNKFIPRILVLNLYSCTFSAFVTLVANSVGIRFLGNTWQYWASSTQSSTLTTYATFLEVYIIFLQLILTVLFTIRFTFVFLYWVTTILVFLTGDIVFISLLPTVMFDKYTQTLRVPSEYSWNTNMRGCIILGFLIYAKIGVSAFLVVLSILMQNWIESSLMAIYLVILHTILARWLGYPTILGRLPSTMVEWAEFIYIASIILAQVVFAAKAIGLLRGLFLYLSIPICLSVRDFNIYIILATYLTNPAHRMEEKFSDIPEFLYFFLDESMALLAMLLLPQVERTIFGTGVFDNPFNNDFVQDNSYGNGLIAMLLASFLRIVPLLIYFVIQQGILAVEFSIRFIRNLVGWQGLVLTGSRYFLPLLPIEYQAWLVSVLPGYVKKRAGSAPAAFMVHIRPGNAQPPEVKREKKRSGSDPNPTPRRPPPPDQPLKPSNAGDETTHQATAEDGTSRMSSGNRLSPKVLASTVWEPMPHFWLNLFNVIWKMYVFYMVLQNCFSKGTADFLIIIHLMLVFTDYWHALSHSGRVTEVTIRSALIWAALIVFFRSTIETHIQGITVERYFQIVDNASTESLVEAGLLFQICVFIALMNGKTMFNFWYRLCSIIYITTMVTLDVLLALHRPSFVRWLRLHPEYPGNKMYIPDNVEVVIRDYNSENGNLPLTKGLSLPIMVSNIVCWQVIYPGFEALIFALFVSIVWDIVFQSERIYYWYGLCEHLFLEPEWEDEGDDNDEDDEGDDESDDGDDNHGDNDEDDEGDSDGPPPPLSRRPSSELSGPTLVGSVSSAAPSSPRSPPPPGSTNAAPGPSSKRSLKPPSTNPPVGTTSSEPAIQGAALPWSPSIAHFPSSSSSPNSLNSSGFPSFERENLYDAETLPGSPRNLKSPRQTIFSFARPDMPTISERSEEDTPSVEEQPQRVSSLSGYKAMKAKLDWIRANRNPGSPSQPRDTKPSPIASQKKEINFTTPAYAFKPRFKRPENLKNASVEEQTKTPLSSPIQKSPNSLVSSKAKE